MDEIDSDETAWQYCSLDDIAEIGGLEFQLASSRAAAKLDALDSNLPKDRLEKLTISLTEEGKTRSVLVNIFSIVQRFSKLKSLKLDTIACAEFTGNQNFQSLATLKLVSISDISLLALSQAFPNVETLDIDHIEFRPHDTSDITWSTVRSLVVGTNNVVPWPRLYTPNLIKLEMPYSLPEGAETFISRQGFLEEIDVTYRPSIIPALINNSKLRMLSTDVDEELGDPLQPTLQNLLSLTLYQYGGSDTLSVELFKRIVRKYCLPNGEANESHSRTLEIFVAKGVNELEWQVSELFASAKVETYMVDRWSYNWQVYKLSWT
jgi:hypothetical protein